MSVMRKTLMLTEENYTAISDLAKRTKSPRHLVLDALIATSDENLVLAKLLELRTDRKIDKVEDRKKRQMVADLVKGMDADALATLLANLKGGSSERVESQSPSLDEENWQA